MDIQMMSLSTAEIAAMCNAEALPVKTEDEQRKERIGYCIRNLVYEVLNQQDPKIKRGSELTEAAVRAARLRLVGQKSFHTVLVCEKIRLSRMQMQVVESGDSHEAITAIIDETIANIAKRMEDVAATILLYRQVIAELTHAPMPTEEQDDHAQQDS